ncbi:hypothetical protein [Dongia sp.]|uniref:hypothetical protein n=1 Tax=Dongia sp. TaxID=1977262 RepID=UPI0035B1AD01
MLLAGILVAGAATLAAVTPGAASADESCSHEEALEMGAKLHEELDVSSERFRDRSLSKVEQKAYLDAFVDLMDASDLALRGKDAEACSRYREIAARMDIDLD